MTPEQRERDGAGTITYLDTTTRHGAPLVIRSYENSRGANVFVNGERVGSIDRGSWDGHAPLLWSHRYPGLPTLQDAVAFVARECGSPRACGMHFPESVFPEVVHVVSASQLEGAVDLLREFALRKWGTTNPVLVPDEDRELQQAYYRATSGGQ